MTTDATDSPIAEPTAPHDDLTFDQLARSYNFRNVSSRAQLFVRLLLKELDGRETPVHALDIGCGNGISSSREHQSDFLHAIAAKTDELWGIKPDTSIQPNHGLFTNFQDALLEDADLPEQNVYHDKDAISKIISSHPQ